jgi:hypothetical protein
MTVVNDFVERPGCFRAFSFFEGREDEGLYGGRRCKTQIPYGDDNKCEVLKTLG